MQQKTSLEATPRQNLNNTIIPLRIKIAIGIIILAYQFVLIGVDVVPISILSVRKAMEYNPNIDIVFWSNFAMFSASSICLIIFGIPLGHIISKISLKKTFILALVLIGIAGVSAGFATQISQFVVSRILFGLGYVLAEVSYINLLSSYVTDYVRKAKIFSIMNTFCMIGNILYALVGGIMAKSNWRAVNFIVAGTLLLVPIAVKFIKEPDIVIKIKGKKNTENNIPVHTGICNKILTFLFGIIQIMFTISFSVLILTTPIISKNIMQNSGLATGICISTMWIGAAITSITNRILFPKVRAGIIYLCGILLFGIGLLGIAAIANYKIDKSILVAYFITGSGVGVVFANAILFFQEINIFKQPSIIPGINAVFMGIGYILSSFAIDLLLQLTSGMKESLIVYPIIILTIAIIDIVVYTHCKKEKKAITSITPKKYIAL